MSKAKIIDKKSVDSILGEKKILSELHHPFIVNMIYSFQDHDYLYLVMDLLPGGNLRYHLAKNKTFNEKQIKFLIGCIMIGLNYIHSKNILHRDIKPENLVFDNNGYLRITDFGIAKHYEINNKKDTSGTIGYLAPEVLCNINHNFSIDYYAVGIITYELMYGYRPYLGKNKNEVKQLILTRQAEIDENDLPDGFCIEIADFINRLIQRKPKNRLGKNNINEVIEHPWFDDFDWENVKKKKIKAPFIPKIGDNFDKKYCLQSNKIGTDTMERYKQIMIETNYNFVFKEYNCNKIPNELCNNSQKRINEKLYGINNNITSNISTTTISRNNNNGNKQNNLIECNNNYLKNNNIMQNNNKNHNNNNYNNDFEKEIFNQIALLNQSLHNLSFLNKNNNINNKDAFVQKNKKNGLELLYNKSSINLFRNKYKDKNNSINNINKTFKNDKINKIMTNNYLDNSSTIMQYNHKNNDNINQKNISSGLDNDNKMFNDKKLIQKIINKRIGNLNHNMSMSNLNRDNKYKNIINNSSLGDKSSNLSQNSGILKNMKFQYKELNSNKRKQILNYSIKEISKFQNNSNNIIINNLYNNSNNNSNIIKSINNSKAKRNTNMSMPKSKKDYLQKEFLRNSILYEPNQSQNQSNSNINLNKKTSILISSTIYSKKKTNSLGDNIINKYKRLSSSHSMHNIKTKKKLIKENAGNYSINNNKKSDFINSDRTSKNILNYKKLPSINISLNKKNEVFGNGFYNAFYGKPHNGNNIINFNEDIHINNDYFTDRFRNKIMKNNDIRYNYNKNKSINNFLDNYSKYIK